MPEYRYPGVYVEEIAGAGAPIAGVATSLDEPALSAISFEYARLLAARAPEWTGGSDADPGVTLLQVFAFLAENLLYRAGGIAESGRSAASRALAALAALSGPASGACGPVVRPSYFAGRLLDAATLTQEQDYHREKRRRHDLELHGFGVVRGLEVRVEAAGAGGSTIVVDPGYAVDPQGEEICLPVAVTLAAPASGADAFVTLRLWERPCGRTPDGRSGVEDACVVGLGASPAAPTLAVARLVGEDSTWRVDAAWRAPRVR